MSKNENPLFEGVPWQQRPEVLKVSWEPSCSSLGGQLCAHDNGLTNELFLPGYASIGSLSDGDTVARRHGVRVGDFIVGVNGQGFRRFPLEFPREELKDVTLGRDLLGEEEEEEELGVAARQAAGEVYRALLGKIHAAKKEGSRLTLHLERHSWDSRVHSWSRFLSYRRGNVPEAMALVQAHERWRQDFFPIDLTQPSLQTLLQANAVSHAPHDLVYLHFASLQRFHHMDACVVQALVLCTDHLLASAPDPRRPRLCQLVDFTGVHFKQGLCLDMLKKIYAVFEPNYPEILHKLVLYPINKLMSSTAKLLLAFANEHTRAKLIITDDLALVCGHLGWNLKDMEHSGTLHNYIQTHSNHQFIHT